MADQQKILGEFWEKLQDSPFVMLGLSGQNVHSEPMTAQFDAQMPGSLYFYTHVENRLVQGLPAAGPAATAVFASKKHDYFASLAGTLSLCTDATLIDHFWSNSVEAWFPDGREDPNLRLLRFDIVSAELWQADLSFKGKIKLLFGGQIDLRDVEQKHVHASV